MGWVLFGRKFIGTYLPGLLIALIGVVMAFAVPEVQFPAYLLLIIIGGLDELRHWAVTGPVSDLAAFAEKIKNDLTATPIRTTADHLIGTWHSFLPLGAPRGRVNELAV